MTRRERGGWRASVRERVCVWLGKRRPQVVPVRLGFGERSITAWDPRTERAAATAAARGSAAQDQRRQGEVRARRAGGAPCILEHSGWVRPLSEHSF